MEEELQALQQQNPDMFDEKVKAIPIEELIKRAVTKRMNQTNKGLSKTMHTDNFNQPGINL
jgi:hypothetical protein